MSIMCLVSFFIILLVCKPILQAKWSGFFAFGSISNFILAILIILINILIIFFTPFIGLLTFFLSTCFWNESYLIVSILSLCSTSQIFELPYTSNEWSILIGVFKTLEFDILQFSSPTIPLPQIPPFHKILNGMTTFFILMVPFHPSMSKK